MKALTGFLNVIDSINELVGRVSSLLVIPMMGIIVYDVSMRYFFNNPTAWALEMCEMLLLFIVCIGGGTALLHNTHVNVGIVADRWTPRMRAMVDLFTYLVLFLICVILVWHGGKITWDHIVDGSRGESVWAPVLWPSWAMVSAAGILLGLQCLAKWLRDLVLVVKGVELKSKWVSGEGGIREK